MEKSVLSLTTAVGQSVLHHNVMAKKLLSKACLHLI